MKASTLAQKINEYVLNEERKLAVEIGLDFYKPNERPIAYVQDGTCYLSAEDGHQFWVDYYQEFGQEAIRPSLDELVKICGYYLEWNNPGQLVCVED